MKDEELIGKWLDQKVSFSEMVKAIGPADQEAEEMFKRGREIGFYRPEELSPREVLEQFFSKYQEGDCIYKYSSKGETWENSMGSLGYAIYRNNKYITHHQTLCS